MLNIVAVHRVDRPDRLPLPDGWHVWETGLLIGETYRMLTQAEYDHDTVIVQDDVRFTYDPNLINLDKRPSIIVYGQRSNKFHVCPRAFSADPRGWALLAEAWKTAPTSLCTGFTWAVDKAGRVFDITEVYRG